ncbi:MAG: Peptidoglycan-binding (PGRP) domain of peptidoglycan hydrolase [Chloroflexi bacterium AL-N10]|nr:Peptidoglycan-binding (PGRP) domain of peptidoglycan hydrolase [Chloroflexi bacterium AL-N10]NOK72178.1 Peptidoglycan-binding (PGRP) domain of peptidoglycan hydrolase [Chloroflexi bacterium AL-N5]
MLTNLYYLSSDYQLEISELAGGAHSEGSTHYSGTAFDIVKINGIPVSSENPYYQDVIQWCRDQGGTTYGPGDAGWTCSHDPCHFWEAISQQLF